MLWSLGQTGARQILSWDSSRFSRPTSPESRPDVGSSTWGRGELPCGSAQAQEPKLSARSALEGEGSFTLFATPLGFLARGLARKKLSGATLLERH